MSPVDRSKGLVMIKRLWTTILLAVLLVVAGCGSDNDRVVTGAGSTLGTGQVEGSVLVFAAASLSDAFRDIGAAFERGNPDAAVQLNLAGSSTLREQILEGAPGDVFASANESNMAAVEEAGEVGGPVNIFARNRLQIAVPMGNPGQIRGLADFGREELLVGLCAEGVPCGAFAREALAKAGTRPAIDTNEPDVRALLTKIGADELDAGIVYVTDIVAAGDRVEGIEIPDDENIVAEYPIAALTATRNPDGAAAFVAFVLSSEGRAILADHGFGLP